MIEENLLTRLMYLRDRLGSIYGSEDLAVFLYSLVRREKPAIFVELGTGLGVTTLWVAAAMKENGHGKIYTVDNGHHYQDMLRQNGHFIQSFTERPVASISHETFINELAASLFLEDYVQYVSSDIEMSRQGWLDDVIGSRRDEKAKKIDVIFSDFDHSPATIISLLAHSLIRLSPVGSILIDSASTSITAYYVLERLEQFFRRGQVPIQMLDCLHTKEERLLLKDVVSSSTFRLMHLIEKKERKQNSTTWLRVEPVTLTPPLATFLH